MGEEEPREPKKVVQEDDQLLNRNLPYLASDRTCACRSAHRLCLREVGGFPTVDRYILWPVEGKGGGTQDTPACRNR